MELSYEIRYKIILIIFHAVYQFRSFNILSCSELFYLLCYSPILYLTVGPWRNAFLLKLQNFNFKLD